MLKNIIFDLGNTVVRFDSREITRHFYSEEKDFEKLVSVTFARKYWDRLDDGSISQEDFKRGVREELPEYLHKYSDAICDGWVYDLPVIDGMEKLIDDLKQDGFGLFVISNISERFSECRDEIPILKKFDKLILSGDEKLAKPDKRIFKLAIERFGINPDESLFADDLPANIKAAEECGIHGYLFDGSAEKLRKRIYSETINK